MLKKVIFFLTTIIVLSPYLSTVETVYADDAQTSVYVIDDKVVTGDYLQDNLIKDRSVVVSPDSLMIGTATISAFLAANPALVAGILILGLGGVALGLKFDSFSQVYDFGKKVREYLTTRAYTAAIDGLNLIFTDDVKIALLKAYLGIDKLEFEDSIDVPYVVRNTAIAESKVNKNYFIDFDFIKDVEAFKVDTSVDGVKVDKYGFGYPLGQVNVLYTNYIEIEMWNTRGYVADVIDGFEFRERDGSKKHFYDYTTTARGGKKFRIDTDVDRYVFSMSLLVGDDTNVRDLFDQNITVTVGDGSQYTFYGDVDANSNPYKDLTGVDKIFANGTVTTPNVNYPITGGVTVSDLPGILAKPDGYSDEDYATIGDIVTADDATDIDTEPDNPDDDDTDESSTDLLDWLRRIFKLLTKFLSPTSNNVIKVLNNTVAIYDLIGQKANESKLHIVGLFGSAMSAISDVGDMVLDIPDKVADLTAGLWTDAGEVWTGIKDDVSKLGVSVSNGFDNVMDGIEQGVKSVGDSLVDLKADTAAKIGAWGDSLAQGIDAVGAKVDSVATSATDAATSVTDWLSDWLVPDFTGIKASFANLMDKLKSKFALVTDLANNFKNAFATKKSIYDIEIDVFDQKINIVPIELKSAIDYFKIFANALCILLTILRIYKRVTGADGDVVAT